MTEAPSDLTRLLASNRSYFWALRQSHARDLTPERRTEVQAEFREAGLSRDTLDALRALEEPLARYPHPAVVRPRHDEYLRFELADFHIYISGALCERGLEAGIELFPTRVEWSFCHHEIQYCTGGDTPMTAVLPSNKREEKRLRAGDVMAIPQAAHLIYDSSEEGDRYGHAHIFAMNLGGMRGEVFYDVLDVFRLETMGLLELTGEPVPFHDITERIEVREWQDLLAVDRDRERDLPTWLRNGWARREETRLLDYHEGTDSLVISSPDREPADYLPWGEGTNRCYVNPILAEASGAIADTRFPAGYRRMLPDNEVWTILSGEARVRQSIPPLHGETVEHDVASGDVMVAIGGANIDVLDASDDFVVRRLAESCAENQHAQMMELRLEADGLHKEL